MCKKRLDIRDRFPSGMEAYLSSNGWHFNRKMCEWAVSRMRRADGGKVQPITRGALAEKYSRFGLEMPDCQEYDAVYVANMMMADYFGSSIPDEMHAVMFVSDYLRDPDGYDEVAFTRFYADCIGKGEVIPWEDVL